MNEKTLTEKQAHNYVDWVLSLQDSLHAAGGHISWESMKKMNVEDLGWRLAPNGIRFQYNKDKSVTN